MRRILVTFVAVLLAAVSYADDNKVYSLDINYLLQKDGAAVVTEVWDIDVAEGTEWYLVRNNMRDIEVHDFMVHDEKWNSYIVDSPWDVDRDLDEKAGRCGIVETEEGLELCWGLGSYGRHCYTVEYVLTNAVQSLDDYDMFHFQTVNRKLSTAPEKVRTVVEVADLQMDTTSVRFWGFGYVGTADLVDGKVVFESSEPFVSESSMICLLRFNKGIFEASSVLEKPFEEHLTVALDNSGYIEEDVSLWVIVVFVVGLVTLIVCLILALVRALQRMVLGINYNDVEESKEIPFGGNLYVATLVMDELQESRRGSSTAAALIIRMIYNGILKVRKVDDENIEISFNQEFEVEGLDKPAKLLYGMMKDASGDDGVLQEKEFRKWASGHKKKVVEWEKARVEAAKKFIEDNGYRQDGRYNAEFQMEACKLVGLKKFLSKVKELSYSDLTDAERLKEYLVYAALFEVAENVVEQVNSVNPAVFGEMDYDYWTWRRITYNNTHLSRAILNTAALSGAAGTGGASSFRGGAGFSGGGVGGGAR